jgi:ribosomal protein L7Ae-like RNA K-turn-binding protein
VILGDEVAFPETKEELGEAAGVEVVLAITISVGDGLTVKVGVIVAVRLFS